MFPLESDPELSSVFRKIAEISFNCGNSDFATRFSDFLNGIGLCAPEITEEEAEILASSVNAQRLKNNPVGFSREELKEMYLGLNSAAR